MKNTHGYEINHFDNTIIVTKKYLKEAGIIGSEAYENLANVRKDLPDYQIVQREIRKKQGKKTYGKLTYERMVEFIAAHKGENSLAAMADFQRVKQLSKAHSGSYAFVKAWFLNRYKDEFNAETESEEEEA